MSRITSFYEKLPRGPAVTESTSNPVEKYRRAHFGDKPTGKRKLLRLQASYA
jgi:Mitochondrial F1-F0 ATP synthase subunit F of fungi